VEINDKTKIGLFTAFGALAILIPGLFWFIAVSFKAEQEVADNLKQDQRLESQNVILLDIRDRTIRIEERLKKDDL
jgi:hypothetical protein